MRMEFAIYRVRAFLMCSLVSLFLLNSVYAVQAQVENEQSGTWTRVYFGSCIKQEKPMPVLTTIQKHAPDAFVFLGDNIYADTEDMQVMRAKYRRLAADKGFQQLVASSRVFATWDDHDYGKNDAGADFKMKEESREIFFEFWKVPLESPRRKHPGVYDSVIVGPVGKRIQLILLDTRFFRSPLKTGKRKTGGPYYPASDPSLEMLGEKQWKWLEKQLLKPAEIRIVASSIQLVAESDGQETWSNLPLERERFFNLLRKTGACGVIVISGDRHWSELSSYSQKMPYTLFDLTSSSLNQPHGRGTPTINGFRHIQSTYHRENYGAIEVDWEPSPPELKLEIRDLNDKTRLSHSIKLSELRLP